MRGMVPEQLRAVGRVSQASGGDLYNLRVMKTWVQLPRRAEAWTGPEPGVGGGEVGGGAGPLAEELGHLSCQAESGRGLITCLRWGRFGLVLTVISWPPAVKPGATFLSLLGTGTLSPVSLITQGGWPGPPKLSLGLKGEQA